MRWLSLLALVPCLALAQSGPCESRCNLQGSECLKACTGDPKDAQKPGESQRLMQCLAQCEAQTRQCKQACAPSRAP